jgi:hypothetical protein
MADHSEETVARHRFDSAIRPAILANVVTLIPFLKMPKFFSVRA